MPSSGPGTPWKSPCSSHEARTPGSLSFGEYDLGSASRVEASRLESVADMVEPFYGTRPASPAGPGRRRSWIGACLLGLPLALGLPGCEGDAPAPPPATPSATPPAVAAVDRDAALDSIDRWLQAGRPDLAEAVARTLVDRLPADRHARAALGRTLLARSGELRDLAGESAGVAMASEAARELEEALELAESFARPSTRSGGVGEDAAALQARRSLGLAQEASDRIEDAIATYRGGGEDETCRLYLGLALLRVDRTEEASRILEDLSGDRPDDPLVRAALAETRFRSGRIEEAIGIADEAVRLDPDSWAIRLRRASILRRGGEARAALESLLALDEAVRGERAVVMETASCWLALDRPERAAEVWARRARTEEADIDAALAAARAFEEAGATDEAEAWLEIAALAAPGDPRVERTRAEIDAARAVAGPADAAE